MVVRFVGYIQRPPTSLDIYLLLSVAEYHIYQVICLCYLMHFGRALKVHEKYELVLVHDHLPEFELAPRSVHLRTQNVN